MKVLLFGLGMSRDRRNRDAIAGVSVCRSESVDRGREGRWSHWQIDDRHRCWQQRLLICRFWGQVSQISPGEGEVNRKPIVNSKEWRPQPGTGCLSSTSIKAPSISDSDTTFKFRHAPCAPALTIGPTCAATSSQEWAIGRLRKCLSVKYLKCHQRCWQ